MTELPLATVNESLVQEFFHHRDTIIDWLCGRIIKDPLTRPPVAGIPMLCI